MNLPDFLTNDTEGEIRLTGHRIGLYHVVQHYNDGDSPEMLASRYPSLPLALIYKVIAFYLDNQPEVDAYVVDESNALTMQRRGGKELDVNALRRRLALNGPTVPEPQAR